MFVASPEAGESSERRYIIEYSLGSPTAEEHRLRGLAVPASSAIHHCTAIGYTESEIGEWATDRPELIEFVGIPGFPGERFPRVAGLLRHGKSSADRQPIRYRHGNVLDISLPGPKIICQLVNDKAIRWGGGTARKFAEKCPTAEDEFASAMMRIPQKMRLGSVVYTDIEDDLRLASIVGQEGFGPSLFPRIRYSALEKGLSEVGEYALAHRASVHLPKIGTGSAGGEWRIIEEIVDNELVRRGLDVTVYDLPPKRKQLELF
jgi:O-acetyl-ADP-ribose deacetylase (regulator of RNase III)